MELDPKKLEWRILAINEAVERAGGQSALARICGVKPQSVHGWLLNGRVPPRRAKEIEYRLGIKREKLCPEIFD